MGSPRAAAAAVAAPSLRARRARLPLAAFVAAVVALAGLGAWFASGIFGGDATTGEAPVELSSGPFGLTEDIPVSFGALAIPYVDRVAGVKSKDVQGQDHNIPNFIGPDKEQVHASISLKNLLDEPVAYAPAQFRLVIGDGDKPGGDDKRVAPLGGTIQAGTLQPDAGVEGRITFVAPRDRSRLWLEFKDPGQSAPIVVDLGRTGKTPAGAFDGFQGHGGHH